MLETRDLFMNKTDKVHAYMGLIFEQWETEKKQIRKPQSIIIYLKEIRWNDWVMGNDDGCAILNRMVREGLYEVMAFDLRYGW